MEVQSQRDAGPYELKPRIDSVAQFVEWLVLCAIYPDANYLTRSTGSDVQCGSKRASGS